jgi:peroxiredoxin Q/BCP
VSADAQAINDRFRASLELPFAIVDPAGSVLRAYDLRWPILGLARRVTYRIGRDARIAAVFHSEWRVDRHVASACPLTPRA